MEHMNQKRLEDNIEIMPVDIKPNEMVLFYRDNPLIGDASGEGLLFFGYDKSRGKFRTERICIPA